MKRKILIIAYHFPPLNSVASSRSYAFAKYLAESGGDVTVLSPDHRGDGCNFMADRAADSFSLLHAGTVNNVNINNDALNGGKRRTHGSVVAAIFKIKKFLSYHFVGNFVTSADAWGVGAAKKALEIVLEKDIEIVISSFSPISSHLAAYYVKRQFPGLLWVADYRDLWTFYDSVPAPIAPLAKIQFMIDRQIMKKADCVVTVSDLLRDFIEQKYGKKVHVVENGYFPEDLEKNSAVQVDIPAKYVFTATGSIHMYKNKRDPSPLFLAFAKLFNEGKLQRKDVEICFYGENTYLLKQIVEDSGLGDVVRLLPLIPREQSLAVQKASLALVFLESDSSHSRGFLTGKLFEYLVSGRPILAVGISAGHAAADVIEKTRTGYVCGSDLEKTAAAIMEIVSGKNVEPDMEEIGKYRRDRLTAKLAVIIENFLSPPQEQDRQITERATT